MRKRSTPSSLSPNIFDKSPSIVLHTETELLNSFQHGLALLQQGNLSYAETIFHHIVDIQTNNSEAFMLLGLIASCQGNDMKAENHFSKVVTLSPLNHHAHYNRGVHLHKLNRLEDARITYEKAISIYPNDPDYHVNLGNVLWDMELADEAINSFNNALKINPNFYLALNNLGNALRDIGNFELSLAKYDLAINNNINSTEALCNKGIAFQKMKLYDNALFCFDAALLIDPKCYEAFVNRAGLFQDLNKFDDAIFNYNIALSIRPNTAKALSNLGIAQKENNSLDSSISSFLAAIEIDKDYADAYWNMSHSLLLSGNFKSGWEFYEWRWKRSSLSINDKNRYASIPLWLGIESIYRKSILLHAEQGLGDTIQFCRYATLVKNLGADVTLEIPKQLIELIKSLRSDINIIEEGLQLDISFDYHCPLMSLPLAFNTNYSNIPANTPYLYADSNLISQWKKRLGKKHLPRVGIAWRGNRAHHNDNNRSIDASLFINFLPNNFEYFCLHDTVTEDESVLLISHNIEFFDGTLINFSETAALCDLMDLVITVDTSVAHLAGALNKKTFILLPYVTDWRWLQDRVDSPWYPSFTLFRQSENRSWHSVFENLIPELSRIH